MHVPHSLVKLNTPSSPTNEGPLGDHAIFARFIAREYFATLFRLKVNCVISAPLASPDRIEKIMTIFKQVTYWSNKQVIQMC